MKVVKTNSRLLEADHFAYYIEFPLHEFAKFQSCRKWCWQTWGASCEFDFWIHNALMNESWCWDTSVSTLRLLIRTEQLLSMCLMELE